MPRTEILTGARAALSISGSPVGFATDVSCSEEVQYEPIRTLDNIQTVEFVPVGYDISFSASRVRLFGGSIRGGSAQYDASLNIFAQLGSNPAEHLQNILARGNMDATITDTYRNSPLFVIEQCQVTRHNWSLTARGVVGEDIEFVGIRIRDETEIA